MLTKNKPKSQKDNLLADEVKPQQTNTLFFRITISDKNVGSRF